ncbi:bifunctional diaminohydroxyphosphoribosylaminopyrimidine deaminase/5-amino-6-(5-phosphoribosylamino)uracil reductase RibD [Butyrivibrio sp. AE3004]|uniref:bifunctional diaminohydroxyphosphoribosylaminopyrimidine deaminase/5-amino-6-(5-phosphoribosylamino)uracil reductase RibD n=1 Tax=Butyrivibrio sp. AE3004 TaxID=1506994 RepID=UPI0004943F2C|nr:bifunctional diaminohydroxyphosphoribosylaminopyrimidine deaminase/5-amino-6-(5-phosphoribosylamino)uracil reductase RibD [Butyrivibrio sp. AE3004]
MNDEFYMKRALELARKGAGFVNPNPMVGAVIVKDGKIIGEGYHERYGELHAERNALKNCSESPKGATMYVTLEPCCHYGKTPPCTEAIIENGISRVVVASLDVNPLVAGKGIKILEEHGISTSVGILKEDADNLNKVFIKYIRTRLPYVVMKYAMTSDGKIATKTGASKWVSSEESRKNVHRLRSRLSAIMVGVGTVISDDPLLTCRISADSENSGNEYRNPIRIICDTNFSTPMDAHVVLDAKNNKTIIATCSEDERRQDYFEKMGCEIIRVSKKDGVIDLKELMQILGERGIDSILLEGGATLNYSALNAQIVDEVQIYIAPKVFGGHAKSPVEGTGIEIPGDAFLLSPRNVSMIGQDVLIENEVIYQCLQA